MPAASSFQHIARRALQYFPAPQFLAMPAAGVELSDASLKYAALARGKRGIELRAHGIVSLPQGAVEQGRIIRPDDVCAILRKVQRDTGIEFAHVSLPEEQAYLFETELSPELRDRAQAVQALEFGLKENVPLAPEEASFDFEQVPGPKGVLPLSVSVYPRSGVEAYQSVFSSARLSILSLEIEGQATARAVIPQELCETALVVDLGKQGSGISIVSKGVLVFAASFDVCGDDLTRAIAEKRSISFDEAETQKQTHGLVRRADTEDMFTAMLPIVAALRDEINRHSMYWRTHSARERSQLAEVEKVILCGGSANLIGLSDYLSATLDVPVSTANVWENILSLEEFIPSIPRAESLRYATALGLAMRGLTRSTVAGI